jgi:beta-phosphoglucomutase-like phosphatase (HAD superfamily)
MAASAARAMFVSADVVSVAISAPSKKRASSSSPTRSMRFSLCGALATAFFAGFFAIGAFYDPGVRPNILLLDIDGTLVDNTAQHIAAWRETFASLGLQVDDVTLRRQIGKGGDLYVKAVAGEEWDRRHGDEGRKLHGEEFKRRLQEVRAAPGVSEFLEGIRQLEIRPVLATSSNPEEVAANLGVIGKRPEDFLIVDKDDIETSKPAPDVFAVALKRSGARPEQAAAVGDTRWDGEAATKTGVVFWGVLTGAGTEEALRLGGAQQVFRDLRALLDFLVRL